MKKLISYGNLCCDVSGSIGIEMAIKKNGTTGEVKIVAIKEVVIEAYSASIP